MTKPLSVPSPVALRQRMIEDMTVRGFSAKTQHDYLRIVSRFAAFLGRSPGTATAEDVRQSRPRQSLPALCVRCLDDANVSGRAHGIPLGFGSLCGKLVQLCEAAARGGGRFQRFSPWSK